MSDQTEPVAPRKYRNRVPRPNSDQPVSNAKSKIVQIMNMLHGYKGQILWPTKGHRAFEAPMLK